MTRILVTGASGLLGLNFALEAIQGKHEVYGLVNRHGLSSAPFEVLQFDLCQPGRINQVFEKVKPDVLVHCAAMAVIDDCEQHPGLAQRVNAEIPGELAGACARLGIQMVHISTDAVFDGQAGNYKETDQPNPLSVYARTKLAGEQLVARENPDALISRINIFGWSLNGQRSLAEWFFNNLSMKKKVNGFTDVYFCPLLVNDLARILLKSISIRLAGIYHMVSSESLSKYEFGLRIARKFGLNENLVVPISWKDGGLVGNRSPNLRVNVDKLVGKIGEPPPSVDSGLSHYRQLFLEGYPQHLQWMRLDSVIKQGSSF
jgi:dTDP-4-dehydrorhamnose reductase